MSCFCLRYIVPLLLALPFTPAPSAQTGNSPAASGRSVTAVSADAALEEGVGLLRAGNAVQAVESFRKATVLRPSFPEAWLNLGLALQQTGNSSGALVALQKAIGLKPNLRGAHLFLGILHYKANHFEQAETALRKETELSPKDAKAWMWLGVDELAEAHPSDAAASLDIAARLTPDDVDVLYHRGRAHSLVSQDSYQKMFKLDPESFRVHQVLAQADAEADRTTEAISEYQLAVQRAPREPGLHEALGDLYWTDGKMELAAPEYLTELSVDANNVTANYKLGGMRVIGGDPAGALEPLQRTLALDPSFYKAYYYLGRAYVDLGKDAEGISNLERACNAPADETLNTLAWYQLVRVYRRAHRTADADAALSHFRELRARLNARRQAKRTAQIDRHSDLPVPEQVPAASADGPAP